MKHCSNCECNPKIQIQFLSYGGIWLDCRFSNWEELEEKYPNWELIKDTGFDISIRVYKQKISNYINLYRKVEE